ncbi:hypothetical protein AO072_03300 [Pseudomonas syringae ICMP 13102]|uniref:PD-(D/E)XK nuclease domain-containing protein n=1 Tax=Pseudomonas syringae TaxID=317 RepID=UPI00073082E6|nr:PD-(D/E)XK nuclease domain-containing protein [Pseudomonas syringae]KTB89603.1 hypothetical protein AO072_03300 [Pseudomonas syringae ICMP 13102]
MTNESMFTSSEKSHLEVLSPGNSGSAEDQFIQEAIEFYRYWQSVRSPGDYGCADRALLIIFAETPDIYWGFEGYISGGVTKARRRSGTVGEGILICNQNFRTMLRLSETLTVDEAYDFVEAYLSDAHTFVVGKFGQQAMQFHRAGQPLSEWIHEPEERLIKTTDHAVTPNGLAKDLHDFHHEYLSTSTAIAARTMWELNTAKTQYDLRTSPERQIQSFLLTYLRSFYRRSGVFVNEEISNQGGRTDIYIQRETSPGSNVQVNTVIELKVLSPKRSFDSNLKWAKEGITQAKGYANANTDVSFTCLYDARRVKDAMTDLPPFATLNSVRLEQYDMAVPTVKAKRITKALKPKKP